MADQDKLKQFIKAEASRLGFSACAVAAADSNPQLRADLQGFVEAGHHGTMDWMAETLERRSDVRTLWPDVRSIIVLGMNYGPEGDPLSTVGMPERGNISVYARHRDYHDVIKGKLKELAGKIGARSGADVKVFVDTAPVMEKPLAMQAGLGWQGKHTNLVSRTLGSWFFLGTIFTTAELAPDDEGHDHCGSCRACVDACPTRAFPAPGRIDARRCISYLTIEHKGPIDRPLRRAMGNRVYGCDDCQLICPWNKFAVPANLPDFDVRNGLDAATLAELFRWTDAEFNQRLEGSPIRRIGHERWLRNIAVAIGNALRAPLPDSARAQLTAALHARADDPSELVREHVAWALTQST